MNPTTPTHSRVLTSCLILGLGGLVFANSLGGGFILDDVAWLKYLARLPNVWLPQHFLHVPSDTPIQGRPLVYYSFAVNYRVGGQNPFGYHVVNLAIHACCAVVLASVLRQLLEQEPLRNRCGDAAPRLALAAALIWLVHPLQTECVNYVSQRTESLAALFYLGVIGGALRSRTGSTAHRWQFLAIACMAMGVATKETVATAPVLVVLMDYVFRSEPFRSLVARRWKFYAALFATWGILAGLMVAFPRRGSVGFGLGVSAWQYAANQCIEVTNYLRLVFWPTPLILDYGYPRAVTWREALPGLALLVVLLGATVLLLARRSPLGFVGAWCFLILGPTSSFIPITTEVAAERRMYLPSMAIIAAAIVGIYLVANRLRQRVAEPEPGNRSTSAPLLMVCCLGGLLVVLSWLTVRRNAEYRDPGKLWQACVQYRPQNLRARSNLAYLLAASNRTSEAIVAYLELLHVWPDNAKAQNAVGFLLQSQRNYAQAVEHYRAARAAAPAYHVAARNLAWLLATCPDDGIRNGEEAVRLALPLCADERSVEPRSLDTLAAAHAETGQFHQAREVAERAWQRATVLQQQALASKIRQRLTGYEHHRPYREP